MRMAPAVVGFVFLAAAAYALYMWDRGGGFRVQRDFFQLLLPGATIALAAGGYFLVQAFRNR